MDCYLTQSSQFYLEMAVPAIGDCYCIYPSFRAEKSHTRRHLIEFLHLETEWKDVFTFEDHCRHLKEMMVGILSEFETPACELFKDFPKMVAQIKSCVALTKDIQILTHEEAIKYCKEHKIYKDMERKVDFGPRDDIPEAQEREMIDKIGKMVFLCKFPKEFKSFYMKPCDEDKTRVQGVDIEVPGVGEIVGSGVRVADPKILIERLKEEGLKLDDYKEYIDLRRYGFSFTSGCGLGVDRMLTWLLGLHSIREVVTFPRYPGRITP